MELYANSKITFLEKNLKLYLSGLQTTLSKSWRAKRKIFTLETLSLHGETLFDEILVLAVAIPIHLRQRNES